MDNFNQETSTVTGTYVFIFGQNAKNPRKMMSEKKVYGYEISDTEDVPEFVQFKGKKRVIRVYGSNLPAVKGIKVRFFGHWQYDPAKPYEPMFIVQNFVYPKPDSKCGIVALLASKDFPGIGEKTAQKLVNAFGDKTLEVIEKTPEMVYNVLKKKHADIITANYASVKRYGELVTFLSDLSETNFTPSICDNIYELLGENAIYIIKNDPYSLLRVKRIGFGTCESIARQLNIGLDSEKRIRGAIIATLREQIAKTGDMYVTSKDLYDRGMALLNGGCDPAPVTEELWCKTVVAMNDRREIAVQINLEDLSDKGQKVFPMSFYEAEYWTAQRVLSQMTLGLSEASVEAFSEALEAYCDESNIQLDPLQKEAVMRSLANRVSIITGGPGTGKTTIVSAIIACYKAVYEKSVLLLAPTGKAARRMTASTGENAFTIHSRLGLYDVENQANTGINPIDEGLVIVDEMSMVDGLLMRHLMDAISLRSTHVVFVGDVDQLPSVGAGAVLRELIASNVVPTTKLTKIYRQDGESQTIVENSQRINKGDTGLVYDDVFRFIEAKSDDEAAEIIRELYQIEVGEFGISEVALLCPRRKSEENELKCVSEEMNHILQEAVNPYRDYKDEVRLNGETYRVGDRIMQWHNTPSACNGEVGTIFRISSYDDAPNIHVEWENGNISTLDTESMKSITLAYAMSIHKSQGSEYSSVIIPILKSHECPLFRRNLLYTGVSRAKQRVTIVGDSATIAQCIRTEDTTVRKTLLSARLRYNSPLIMAKYTVEDEVIYIPSEPAVSTELSTKIDMETGMLLPGDKDIFDGKTGEIEPEIVLDNPDPMRQMSLFEYCA